MNESRRYWLNAMLRIAEPVLKNLAQGTLKKNIPTAFHPDREEYIHLEALGRILCGMAPWLELEGVTGEEAQLQTEYRDLARRAIAAAVDPDSPDRMNFDKGYGQSLVDAAFLAHGILRAPKQLYGLLDGETKENLIGALKSTRKFATSGSNWLFFTAMIEATLYMMGHVDYRIEPVKYAADMFSQWYLGDGTYGDGPSFRWDYYNSFVIQPMYIDILRAFKDEGEEYCQRLTECEKRGGRYAAVLERLIAPDGTYPVIGRSVTYRFGAFQLLSQAALQEFLPPELPAPQVRCAIEAVIRKVMENGDMFDAEGWLRPGVCGYQPDLAEGYISVGSLYLCESVFLVLGLPTEHEFWSGEDAEFTSRKIWSGKNMAADHAVD